MSLSSRICALLYALARERNGENADIDLNGVPILVIQRLEDADRILRRNAGNYLKNMAWFRHTLGASRFSEDGEAWVVHRDLTQPYFAHFDRDRTIASALRHGRTACRALLDGGAHGGDRLDDAVFRHMTAAVLSDVFLDRDFDTLGVDQANLARLMEVGSAYSFVPAGRTAQLYREFLAELPALRRKVLADLRPFRADDVPCNHMLQGLRAADRDKATGVTLEHELLTFFAAGAETSAATMGWACHLLARHPAIQEELRAAVDGIWQGPEPDRELLSQSVPLANFISETLRLFPPTPIIARLAIAEDRIGERAVSAGQNILISFIGIQHDARWRADPWMPDIGAACRAPAGGSAMAFSIGPRVCGGKQFALTELTALLGTFVRMARFEPTSDAPPDFLWKSQMLHVGGQPVRMTPREDAGA